MNAPFISSPTQINWIRNLTTLFFAKKRKMSKFLKEISHKLFDTAPFFHLLIEHPPCFLVD